MRVTVVIAKGLLNSEKQSGDNATTMLNSLRLEKIALAAKPQEKQAF